MRALINITGRNKSVGHTESFYHNKPMLLFIMVNFKKTIVLKLHLHSSQLEVIYFYDDFLNHNLMCVYQFFSFTYQAILF